MSATKPKSRGEKPHTFIPPGCEAMLSMRQVCALLGVSPSTLKMMIARGDYPRPKHVGKLSRWRQSVHNKWVDDTFPED